MYQIYQNGIRSFDWLKSEVYSPGLLHYLENQKNQEKSGNLKIDQKVKVHKIDWLVIANRVNFTSMLEVELAKFGLRNTYMWFFWELAEICELLTLQFAEIHELFISLSRDFEIIKISYCEILLNFELRIPNFWIFWKIISNNKYV